MTTKQKKIEPGAVFTGHQLAEKLRAGEVDELNIYVRVGIHGEGGTREEEKLMLLPLPRKQLKRRGVEDLFFYVESTHESLGGGKLRATVEAYNNPNPWR